MKVLIAYDGSASGDAAVEDVKKAGIPPDAEMRVICVDDSARPANEIEAEKHGGSWPTRVAEAEESAGSAAERLRLLFPFWHTSAHGLLGAPAKIILETCDRFQPDLLIVGSHGRSRMARMFPGSVSLELVHKARCSVRVARAADTRQLSRAPKILIAIDGSNMAESIVRWVAARRWPEDSQARIVSAVPTLVPSLAIAGLQAHTFAQEPAYSIIREADERERTRLLNVAEYSSDVLRRTGLIASAVVADGDPRDVIFLEAEIWKPDAIFVGARGLGRLDRLFLGSVSTHVVLHASCTVEVVRNKG